MAVDNTILVRRGSGTPSYSDFTEFELAYDYSADKLYIRDGNAMVEVGGSGGGNSTATSSFLTGDSLVSYDGYIMTRGIVNENETGGTPAAITFGNGATYANDNISLITSGATALFINSSGNVDIHKGMTINQNGGAYDTRIEGDTDTHLFFVDASADRVGISTSSPGATLDIGDRIYLKDDGTIHWGSAAAHGILSWDTGRAIVTATGANNLDLKAASGYSVVVNESGSNVDFRVEGDTDTNLFFADASTDRVGIGTASPSVKFQVAGHTRISGVGNELSFDTTGTNASNKIKTINDYETLIANGRGSAGFAVIGNSNIRLGFGTNFTNAETDLFINNNGRVGIGEVSVDANLHITGSPVVLKMERAGVRALRMGVADNSSDFIFADSDDLKSSVRMKLTGSGVVDIPGSLTLGTALAIAEGGTGATSAHNARIGLGLGNLAELHQVTAATIADNNVGAAELNVSGNGSSGQVLASDGDGSFSWVAQSSGAVSAVANGSNNRIATFSSSTALNGESNLTFDGTSLANSDGDVYLNTDNFSTQYRNLWTRVGYGDSGTAYWHKLCRLVITGSYKDYNMKVLWTSRYDSGILHLHLNSDNDNNADVDYAYVQSDASMAVSGNAKSNTHFKYTTPDSSTVDVWVYTPGWRELDYIRIDSITEGEPSVTFYDESTTTQQTSDPGGTAFSQSNILTTQTGVTAAQVTSGTFADARIPNLAASKITSGTFANARIPSFIGDVTGTINATVVGDNTHNHHSITSNTGDVGDSRLQYWQANSNTTLNPNSNWFTAIRMGHGDPVTYYSNTIAVQMTGTGTGDLYTRNIAAGTAGSWFKHLHTGNGGGGSNFDADKLDGIHASQFLRNDAVTETITSQDWNDYINATEVHFSSVTGHTGSNRPTGAYTWGVALSYAVTSGGKFQLYAPETATLGSATNQGLWYRTGWNTTYRQWAQIWDSTNDGSGSGLDADKLDGQHGSYYYSSANQPDISDITGVIEGTTFSGTYPVVFSIGGANRLFSEDSITFNGSTNVLAISGNTVWHAGNDGGGSGLDADKIDGLQSSQLLRNDSNGTLDGNLTLASGHYFTAHNESSYQKYDLYAGNGNYCIGMKSGNSYGGLNNDWAMTFTFNDDADRGFLWRDTAHEHDSGAMALTTNGKLSVAHSARIGYGETESVIPGATYRLDVSGSIGATADVVAYISSDKRLKDNIKNIANPLEKLEKLNGVEFDWNDKQDLYKGHDIGVIAQEVEEVLPEIVDTREDGHKAVKYDRMVALLIEAVKEQQQQINELKEKLNG